MSELFRLIGVFNADGGFVGELKYGLNKLLNRSHCSLCDITHSGISEKKEMKQCRNTSPISFELIHRNEQPLELEAITLGNAPCVAGQTIDGFHILISRDELERCSGDVQQFSELLDQKITALSQHLRDSNHSSQKYLS